jgi:hypothetical protein
MSLAFYCHRIYSIVQKKEYYSRPNRQQAAGSRQQTADSRQQTAIQTIKIEIGQCVRSADDILHVDTS